MTHPEPTGDRSPPSVERVWLKYAAAIGLAALALGAGLSGIGPWPESGFVSGVILLATGPFFALRMASLDPSALESNLGGRGRRTLPWATAALGLVEIAVVFWTALSLS